MTEEKVIKGLMCIAGDVVFCAHCKYSDVNGSGCGDRCKRDCAKDALALLKAQMPRVMTLEEVHNWINADTMQRDPIFEETRGHDYGEWIDPFDDYDTADIVGYGESVRCWSTRPTDEQRKAVAWENNGCGLFPKKGEKE